MILLCGGTGALGAAIARELATREARFRALVRDRTDAGELDRLGTAVVRGDFRDPSASTAPLRERGRSYPP